MPPSAALSPNSPIAYMTMEVGLREDVPTYSGGLGILAGDTLKAAADMGMPLIGVTLLHRKGYFRQRLDAAGWQTESPVHWCPEDSLEEMAPRVALCLEGRPVHVRAWRFLVQGHHNDSVPVYFLDTDLPENDQAARDITQVLYGGDSHARLVQEAVLGLGGPKMLNALGYPAPLAFHMNEGHSALVALALLERFGAEDALDHITEVRRRCLFTTHTPVAAGHDVFPGTIVRQVLGDEAVAKLEAIGAMRGDQLNMTYLALIGSRWVNGVSMRHEEISRSMFPGYPITSITNGVHAATWTSQPFQDLFDKYAPEWRMDNRYLRHAIRIPLESIREAHSEAKRALFAEIERKTGTRLDPERLTIGFARRATPYKRADMLFSEEKRLAEVAKAAGGLQIVYGGKAHPRDQGGKDLIHRVFEASKAVGTSVRTVYLEEYDIELAKLVVAGVDVWLNTPMKPLEASGTSGMKAALNGVPSLSVLDGWWIEGHVEGVTGWAIGGNGADPDPAREQNSLYHALEHVVVPAFRDRPLDYATMSRSCIALNGSFFNAQRMLSQYIDNAYGANGENGHH